MADKIKLRSLKEEDYSMMRLLSNDEETIYQWAWYPPEPWDKNEETDDEEYEVLFPKYTKEKFQQDLNNMETLNKVYAVEKNEEMIGFVRIENTRIVDWGMVEPNDMINNKSVLDELKKVRKKLTICTAFYRDFFEKNGFIEKKKYIYFFQKN